MTHMPQMISRLYILFLAVTIPHDAIAQGYNLLAPIGSMTTAADIPSYLNGVFQVTIGLAGILAVVMTVICGIRMMGTASSAAKSEAKACIMRSLIGLGIAIGAWTLLNTINTQLISTNFIVDNQITTSAPAAPGPGVTEAVPTVPGWYFRYQDGANVRYKGPFGTTASTQCVETAKQAKASGTTILPDTATGLDCFEVRATPISAGEAAVRTSICGNSSCVTSIPIGINNSACPYIGAKNCTNVAGLPGSAITAVKNLQSACGCNVVISGGTENWLHAGGPGSHGPGNEVLDFRKLDGLNNYIFLNATKRRASFVNDEYLVSLGGVNWWFTNEDAKHWHACRESPSSAWYCQPCLDPVPSNPTAAQKKLICQKNP
jgi:hypothetical protein